MDNMSTELLEIHATGSSATTLPSMSYMELTAQNMVKAFWQNYPGNWMM